MSIKLIHIFCIHLKILEMSRSSIHLLQEASVQSRTTESSSISTVLSFQKIEYVSALDNLFMFQVMKKHLGFNLNNIEPN
jgi:hypothetical protein